MQTSVVVEPKDIEALIEKVLAKAMPKIIETLNAMRQEKEENPWLCARDYCDMWDISNATFWRHLKLGKIEAHPQMANDKEKLYRRNHARTDN